MHGPVIPALWEAEAGGFLNSRLALFVYRVSSRTARATQRNPGSKKTNPTPQKKTTEKKPQKTKTNTKTKTMHGYTISKPNHIQLIHRNIGFI